MSMSVGAIARAYRAARRIGGYGERDEEFRNALQRSYRWLARAVGPKDLHPGIGDGHLGSATKCLEQGQEFFQTDTDRYVGVDRTRSHFFPESGFAAMRNGPGKQDAYLFHTFGPWGGWHSHMDPTSFSFFALGEPLIEEAGRFEGYDNPLSFYLRAPECHNIVTVDGAHFDADDIDWRVPKDPVWLSTPDLDFLTCHHRAYRYNALEPQSTNITIRRTVVFVKDPGYALVFDSAIPENSPNPIFTITQNWHSPWPFRTLGPDRARTEGEKAMLLIWGRRQWLRRLEPGIDYGGEETKEEGRWAERYHLRARRWADIGYDGAIGFATVLYPFEGSPPEVTVRPVEAKCEAAHTHRAEAIEVTRHDGRDLFVLNPETLPGLRFENRPVSAMGFVKLAGEETPVRLET
jgi:hypothetical protein